MRAPTISSRPAPAPKADPVLEAAASLEVDHDEPRASIPSWLRETPYWAVSAVLHLLLFAVLLSIISEGRHRREEPVVMQVAIAEETLPPYDPKRERETERRDSDLIEKSREVIFDPVVREPEVEFPEDVSPPEADVNTNARLPLIGLNDHQMPGLISARPVGPGAFPGGGPSGRTEDVVRAALEWLARHQSPDGSWKSRDYTDMCTDTCTCLDADRHGDGRGFANHDVGVTGLAVLAFAGSGHTHIFGRVPKFRRAVDRAQKYLRSVQVKSPDPGENGRYGPGDHEQWIYDHSIATMALGELLAMTGDELNLERSVTDATRLCLHAQNSGFGWKYGIKPGRNDTSVTGWMVLALKTARYCDLRGVSEQEFEQAFQGALNWFDRASSVASGKTGYEVPGDEGSRLARGYPGEYPYSKDLSCMTAVSVLCRIFSGDSRRSPVIKRGVDILMKETPRWQEAADGQRSTVNMYYWYYASYAMFQFGGSLWKSWNRDMQAALIPMQRRSVIPGAEEPGCVDGSWDPIGEWGLAGGRVYSTAIGAMTMEVYYRFKRLSAADGGA